MKLDQFEFVEPKVPTKEDFITELRTWFNSHPEAKSIYIRAYVPYWCDGDVCEFSVQYARQNPTWELGKENEVLTDAEYDEYFYGTDDKELAWLQNEYSRTLEIMFGSHFEVIIDRELEVQHATFEDHD